MNPIDSLLPHLPFLRAIVESPDDDLPRLVYADFLEETLNDSHADRAAFIRKQVEMMRHRRGSKEFDLLYRDVAELLDKHYTEWITELGLPHPDTTDFQLVYTWERGFIEGLVTSWIEFLEFHNRPNSPWENVPIRHLTLRRALAADLEIRALTPLNCLHHLKRLRVAYADHYSDAILRIESLSNLQSLDLSDNPLTDRAVLQLVHQLGTFPFARSLRELDLSSCTLLTSASLNVLASARSLESLDRLVLQGIHPRDFSLLRRRFGDRLVT